MINNKYELSRSDKLSIKYLEKSAAYGNDGAIKTHGQIYQNNNQIDKMYKLYITNLKSGNNQIKIYFGDYFKNANNIDNMILQYSRTANDNIH